MAIHECKDRANCNICASSAFLAAQKRLGFRPVLGYQIVGNSLWIGGDPSAYGYIPKASEVKPLEVRVTEDIQSLTAGLEDFAGKEELPQKPIDLSKYEDAYAQAVKTCSHQSLDTTNNVEFTCTDCGRYGLTRPEIVRAREMYGDY